jgi:hypothetical protein
MVLVNRFQRLFSVDVVVFDVAFVSMLSIRTYHLSLNFHTSVSFFGRSGCSRSLGDWPVWWTK